MGGSSAEAMGTDGQLKQMKETKNGMSKYNMISLYVGNLPLGMTKGELYEIFKACGDVGDIFLSSPTTNSSYTYGFVRFKGQEGVKRAIEELHDWPYKGNKLIVQLSNGGSSTSSRKPRAADRRPRPLKSDSQNANEIQACLLELQRDPVSFMHPLHIVNDKGDKQPISYQFSVSHMLSDIDDMDYEPVKSIMDEGAGLNVDVAALDQLVAEINLTEPGE